MAKKFTVGDRVLFSDWENKIKKSKATIIDIEPASKCGNYITIKFDNKEDSLGYGGNGTAPVWPKDIKRITIKSSGHKKQCR